MILFVLASIGFFIFSFGTILQLVWLWQRNKYKYSQVRFYEKQQKTGFLKKTIVPFILLITIAAYGFVIFQEGTTLWYRLGVTLVFILLGLFSARTLRPRLKRPALTFFSLTITLLSLSVLISLFLIPLVDQFLWLVILAFLLPFFVIAFMMLFAFPREIYMDTVMQRAKRKIDVLSHTRVILLNGGNDMYALREYLLHILTPYMQILSNKSYQETPFSLARVINKNVTADTQLMIFTIRMEDTDDIEKLRALFHPFAVIFTGISKTYDAFPKEKNKILINQKKFIETLPRNSVAIMNEEDESLAALTEKIKKIVLTYGVQEENKRNTSAIVGFDIHERKDGVWFGLKMGRRRLFYKSKLHGRKHVLTLLPALFIAHMFHIPQEELEKSVKILGRK